MPDWPRALHVYLGTVGLGDLAWEAAHLPLYTIWRTGTLGEKAFAIVHCTGGDLLIALACLALALVLVEEPAWPARAHRRVAGLTVGFGVTYTVFSEWLNIVVRQTWAYSDLMPVVPVIGTGLLPLLQWVIVPCTRLEDRILATLKQAMIDDRLDVAEHLLRALEALAPDCAPESPLAAAYLLIGGPKDP
jgi:hypothetical protein